MHAYKIIGGEILGKYYAVKRGRKSGIFNTWTECAEQVKGYKGALYKSFTTLKEAEKYIHNTEQSIHKDFSESEINIYVDGSYSKNNISGGYGCVIVKNNKIIHTISNPIVINDVENLWNVAGEIEGSLAGIEWAINNKYNSVSIYYDYAGIENWANGSWEAKKDLTKYYVDKIKEYSSKIKLSFVKVKAHSGDEYNELADQLAKEASYLGKDYKEKPITLPEEKSILTIDLYKSIVGDISQDKFLICIGNFNFTESSLKKIAKYFWKSSGYKIKELGSIKISIESNLNTLIIIFQTDNGEINKSIYLEGN